MTQQAMTAGVPVEANKALIRRFIEEVHNKGNFALFNEGSRRTTSITARLRIRMTARRASRGSGATALPPRICVSRSTT